MRKLAPEPKMVLTKPPPQRAHQLPCIQAMAQPLEKVTAIGIREDARDELSPPNEQLHTSGPCPHNLKTNAVPGKLARVGAKNRAQLRTHKTLVMTHGPPHVSSRSP